MGVFTDAVDVAEREGLDLDALNDNLFMLVMHRRGRKWRRLTPEEERDLLRQAVALTRVAPRGIAH